MEHKRIPGRPARGIGDVGRERLLEGARAFLRSKPPRTISRQEIAKAAGVTPALVSYYFPDKLALIQAAVVPVLEPYLRALDDIVEAHADDSDRLERLVGLCLDLTASDIGLLDALLECLSDDQTCAAKRMLTHSFEVLSGFVEEGAARGSWRRLDPTLVLVFIWGLCRAITDTASLEALDPARARSLAAHSRTDQIRIVTDLVVRGIR